MKKPKNIPPRVIYESMLGQRVSDSQWSRITNACRMVGITMDTESIKLLLQLRKVSPQFVYNILALKASQPDPVSATSCTGKEVFTKIKTMGINPDLSTMYRWFYKAGVEFSASTIYDAPTVALVLLQAQIYLMKQKRIKYERSRT